MERGNEKVEVDSKGPRCHREEQEWPGLCPADTPLAEARAPPRPEPQALAQHSGQARQEVPPLGSNTAQAVSVTGPPL